MQINQSHEQSFFWDRLSHELYNKKATLNKKVFSDDNRYGFFLQTSLDNHKKWTDQILWIWHWHVISVCLWIKSMMKNGLLEIDWMATKKWLPLFWHTLQYSNMIQMTMISSFCTMWQLTGHTHKIRDIAFFWWQI